MSVTSFVITKQENTFLTQLNNQQNYNNESMTPDEKPIFEKEKVIEEKEIVDYEISVKSEIRNAHVVSTAENSNSAFENVSKKSI